MSAIAIGTIAASAVNGALALNPVPKRRRRLGRVVVEETDRIVGAQIVGHEGAELIHISALSIKHGISATALRQMVYSFPTFSADIKSIVG